MARVDLDTLTTATSSIFCAAGVAHSPARSVAQALVEADARGISSHGVSLVPMYIDRLMAGSVSTRSEGEVVSDMGAIAAIDAHHALGVLTSDQAMELAVHKAETFGIGMVTVAHAFHFGGAFRYVQAAMDAGFIGIAASNTRPMMPAPGGATAVVGNNPLAVGVPGSEPFLIDMALSEVALGKIRLAESENREIPPNWATDYAGRPTTDPAEAIAGLLLPAGGPKGYGLALAVDALTGILSGGAFGSGVKGLYADVSVANDCAHMFAAINPSAFGDDADFSKGVTELIGEVRNSQRASDSSGVLLPGERKMEASTLAHREGIELPEVILTALAKAAESVGTALPESMQWN